MVQELKVWYIVAGAFWLLILWLLGLINVDKALNPVFILLPIALFAISFFSQGHITTAVENFVFRANILTLGVVFAMPLINWLSRDDPDRYVFMQIMAVAIILSVATLLDVWCEERYLPVVKHVKSSLQTMAISLIIYGCYIYFTSPQYYMKIDETLQDTKNKRDGSGRMLDDTEDVY